MFENLFPIDWQALHFLRPHFLWMLLPVALILFFSLLAFRQEVRWKRVIAPHLRPYVMQKGSERVKVLMYSLFAFALGMGVVGLAGPTWKKVERPGQVLRTPLVILLDLSQSMMAEDLQPNRLERAKFKIRDLLEAGPRARTALIGFAGTAHTIVPLSSDYDIILNHIDGLSPAVMPFPGSDLEAALQMADTLIASTEAPGHVLIVTDDLADEAQAAIQAFAGVSGSRVYILPVNTPSGSAVPARQGSGQQRDASGNPVFSSLDPNAIALLSGLEGVTVQALTLDNSDVEAIAQTIRRGLLFTEEPEETQDEWRDAGLLPVIPMALLLLLWFRKGWVLYSLLLVFLASCGNGQRFEDYWFTRDYQGQRLSQKGDFEAAAERYEDPMRRGVAYFKAGDFEEAIQAFSQDTSANGAYNLGLAYFENGNYAAAAMAFGQAAEMDPGLSEARQYQQELGQLIGGEEEIGLEEAQEAGPEGQAENQQNDSMEDLGGGGQEATQEDMEKERKEETVATDIRKGQELEEVPDDIGAISQPDNSKVLMRKVDDDPSLFLTRKFAFQVKKGNIKPKPDAKDW